MAKTSTLRKRFAQYPVLARAAAGILPALWEMESVVRKMERGALGETALHWAMQDGRADWAVAWAKAGGAVLADAKGSTPLHWMASAVSGAAARAMWGHPGFAAAYAPYVEIPDGMGRDIAGLCCLGLSRWGLAALAEHVPEALGRGVRLGLGPALGLADAMLACHLGCDPEGIGEAGAPWVALLGRLAPPSRRMPVELDVPGGLWSQRLWEAAVAATASSEQLARMEGSEIGAGLASAGLEAKRLKWI